MSRYRMQVRQAITSFFISCLRHCKLTHDIENKNQQIKTKIKRVFIVFFPVMFHVIDIWYIGCIAYAWKMNKWGRIIINNNNNFKIYSYLLYLATVRFNYIKFSYLLPITVLFVVVDTVLRQMPWSQFSEFDMPQSQWRVFQIIGGLHSRLMKTKCNFVCVYSLCLILCCIDKQWEIREYDTNNADSQQDVHIKENTHTHTTP